VTGAYDHTSVLCLTQRPTTFTLSPSNSGRMGT
jgi:hypothetical protein